MTAHLSGIGIKAGMLVGPNCKYVVPTVAVARNSHLKAEVVGYIHRAVRVVVPAVTVSPIRGDAGMRLMTEEINSVRSNDLEI